MKKKLTTVRDCVEGQLGRLREPGLPARGRLVDVLLRDECVDGFDGHVFLPLGGLRRGLVTRSRRHRAPRDGGQRGECGCGQH